MCEKLRSKCTFFRRIKDSRIGPIAKHDSKRTEISENASSETSNTYEEYVANDSYEVYKLDDSYEVYVEKYQDYGHFRKFQTGKISSEPSDTSSPTS